MTHRFKKFILIPILILVLLGPILAPFAESFNFPDRYDLAAILVEQGLYGDPNDYGDTNIKTRVDRYAIDLQNALPGTRAVIIQVDRFEAPENITAVLERLYFEGDPKEPNRIAYLKGVVIVGEVPLPVVNKRGNRFISLFPYTDFENRAYVWNGAAKDFEINLDNPSPQPEIWHGVIRPPVSTQTEDGKNLIAAYFDKNHAYHIGDPEYANFNKRVFFQDFFEEAKNLNAAAYKNYLNFLNHPDDIAYMRYTRELYKDLAGPMEEELAQDEEEAASLTEELAAAGIPSDSEVPQPGLPGDAPAAGGPPPDKDEIPDIMTKIGKMSDNLMFRFDQVPTKYPSLINDFIKYTGRYITSTDDEYKLHVDSAVNLIKTKDQFTLSYLRGVNDMVEEKVDEIVNQLQKSIPLATVKIEVSSARRPNPDSDEPPIQVLPGEPGLINTPAEFVNYSPTAAVGGHIFPDRLNGYFFNDVTNVAQCTPYRGSKPLEPGSYAKLVEINRAFNMQTASDAYERDEEMYISGRNDKEKRSGYQCHFGGGTESCEAYEHFAGCFYDQKGDLINNPSPALGRSACFPEHATDPVFDRGGTKVVEGLPPQNYDNFNYCLQFYEKEQYIDFLEFADGVLEALDNDYDWSRNQKLGAITGHLIANPIVSKEKHPDSIVLYQAVAIAPLTLGHILRGLGWDPAVNPGGWREVLGNLLTRDLPPNIYSVSVNHPHIVDLNYMLTRPTERLISSVMYHKEPTKQTLAAQAANLITKDLPVDDPRYVTFQNRNGGVEKIIYPDIYDEASFDAYRDSLGALEAELNAIPRAAGTPPPCNQCLRNLVSPLAEISNFPAGKDIELTRANQSKVFDALNWKNMDIDSKHKYLSEYYLDFTKNAYVGESTNGYEMLYFNGEGAADHYAFSLNKDIPEEDDGAFKAGKDAAAADEKDEPYKDDPANPFDDEPEEPPAGGYDLFTWNLNPVSPWWERMQEWAADLKETVTAFSFGQSEEEFYAGLEEENRRSLEQVQQESSGFQSAIAGGDEPQFSKIAALEFSADSNVLVIRKRAEVTLNVKDKDGKVVRDEFARVTLTLEGEGAEFSEDVKDEDAEMPGVQISIFSGSQKIAILAPDSPAAVKLTAQHLDSTLKTELAFSVLEDAKLALQTAVTGVVANGSNDLTVNIFAWDDKNEVITGANGVVRVGLSDGSMGQIVEKEVRLSGGKGTAHFIAGKRAGKAVLNATSGALNPGQLEVALLPGPPVRIGLTADPEILPAIPGGQAELSATLFDLNGNAVDTNSSAEIQFRISEKTSRFGNLSSESERVTNGVAKVILTPREETGIVNVIAQSAGLTPASLTVKSSKYFGEAEVSQMKPDALTATLLGIPGGNVTERNYLGGWFLMNGKTEAVNSLTAQPKQYKKIFEVNSNGGLQFPDPARVSAKFLPANNFTLVLRDTQLQLDLAELTIFTLKEGQFEITEEANPERLADGIYIKKVSAESAYVVDRVKGALRVVKSEEERLEIQTNGFLRIFDNSFSVRPRAAGAGNFLILEVLDNDTPVAEIFFVQRFSQDVILKQVQDDIAAPGVYVKPFKLPPRIFFSRSFTGNSSSDPRGAAFYDKDEVIQGASAPGFAFQSLEDSLERFGVGFTEDNKFAHLFSAGETFGEANRPYASDIGIVLGDPTVRINNEKPGGFSQDVGKLLYAASAEVRGIISLDYNSDGFEDIFIVEGEGKIRLIQNNGGYDQLKDQGYIVDIKNGIQDLTKVDFNNDGQMDLVIAGTDTCRKGDTCIDIYENRGGAFVRRNLRFDQKDLVVTVRAEDLNLDNFPELILADTSGDIKILYNRAGDFDRNPQIVGNVGLQVDPAKNLIQSVLIRYQGMSTKNPGDPASVQQYQTLSIKEPNPAATVEGFGNFFPEGVGAPQIALDDSVKFVPRDFMYADLDVSAFANSSKFAQDLNGGVVKPGDRIRYTLTLRNDSFAQIQKLSISDNISEQVELDPASIQCTDCPEGEMEIEPLTGDPTRPYLFKNIRVPARASRHIVYEITFNGDTATSPKVTMAFNHRFTDTDPGINAALQQDDFPDLSVSKEDNPTGRVRYYYTQGIGGDGRLIWDTVLSSAPAPATVEDFEEKTGLNIPSQEEINDIPARCRLPGFLLEVDMPSRQACEAVGGTYLREAGPPEIAKNGLTGLQDDDADGDGIQDSIDDVNGALDGLADSTAAAINNLTCNAGCIALPVNIAFLSPGFFSILGAPDGYDIGLPVFGWGAPSLIPTWPPMPPLSTLGGRFYVSPSITGGVGFAVCLGPFGTPKNCYSFGINALDLLPGNICDKLSGVTSGAMAKANSVISKANEGVTLTVDAKGGVTAGGGRQDSGSGMGNYSLGSYESPVARSRNIKIPGFPSVIADWWAAQTEEFTDKVLSLPDIYLIYPDGDSIIGAFKPTQEFENREGVDLITNILAKVDSMPIIDIETQEVLLKVPIITRKEIEKFKADAQQWVQDEIEELNKWRNMLGCVGLAQLGEAVVPGTGTISTPGNFMNVELCKFVSVEMNKLIDSVVANMKALDEWILFPKKVLQFRAIQSYYLTQIMDYLDTIIQFTGGWVKKNTARVKQWRRAVRQIKQAIETWKAMIELMVDYQESCDKCKTERYSLKDLILKLFIAIPAPPVIPLPKLPDIIIDVSKIQAGLRIQWPDVKFKAEPITLPKIPRIGLGVNLTIPMFKLMVPPMKVIPPPPQLPALPALPPLNLPKLPDLPPPPTMPALPGKLILMIDILKKIVKILCLIKLGFIPTDELLLKTRIEEITARGLTPLLPIDLLFTVQSPTITVNYVDQLKVTAFTNLQFDTSYVLDKVAAMAAEMNKFSTGFAKGASGFLDALSKQIEKYTNPTINIGVPGPEGRQLNLEEKGVGGNLRGVIENREERVEGTLKEWVGYAQEWEKAVEDLKKENEERNKELAAFPKSYTLTVDTIPFTPSTTYNLQPTSYPIVLPFQKRLKEYRDHLAAYVNETEKMFSHEGFADDLADFNRFLANSRSAFVDKNLKRYVAGVIESGNGVGGNWRGVMENGKGRGGISKIAQFDFEGIPWVPEDETSVIPDYNVIPGSDRESNRYSPARGRHLDPRLRGDDSGLRGNDDRLLALLAPPNLSDFIPPGALPEGTDPSGAPEIQNIGIFFVDTNGEGRRLINYTFEADKASQLADIDIDNDGDTDKIYSYGANVFVKKNSKNVAPETRPIFRPVDLEFWTIFELLPKGMSSNFPKALTETAHEASFSFVRGAMDDVAGFEVVAKNSPLYFEEPGNHETLRAHLLVEPDAAQTAAGPAELTLQNADGEVTINGAAPETLTAKADDYVQTGDDSSVTLTAADGTVLQLSENTGFTVPKGGSFELAKGSLEINLPASGSAIFPSGTEFNATEGEIRVRLFDGSEVRVTPGAPFTLPEMKPVYASLKMIAGEAEFTGRKRDYIQSQSGKITVLPGEMLHPLGVTEIKWNIGNPGERTLTLSKEVMLPIPDSFANGIEIEVEEGVMEVIRTETSTQPAAAGMALIFGDKIKVKTGSAVIHYRNGGDHVIRFNETYLLNKADNLENPTGSLALDPAFYFGKIYSFNSKGERSSASEKLMLAPQVCGDKTAPFANLGKAQFTVAVGKTLPLDATKSFDTMSNVISYWLDTDVTLDSDTDGVSNNDRDLFEDLDSAVDSDEDGDQANDTDSPRFTIGPYTEVGQKQMRLTVRDEALNEGYQDITVDIITPRIVLEEPPLKDNIIQGFVEPAEFNVPITIAKLRPGTSSPGWEILRTPSASPGGQYFTDHDGRFKIEDADLRDRLVIRNSEGKIVAEINTSTGRVTVTDDRYEARLMPSVPPTLPMRIGIFLKADPSTENPLTYVFFIPDVNTDVVIDGSEVVYDKDALFEMSGSHVKPLPRAFELNMTFVILPGDDSQAPGAAVIEKDGAKVAAIDVNGDIISFDPAVLFRVKDLGFNIEAAVLNSDPVTFEMLYNREPVAEIFIAAHLGTAGRVQIVDAPKLPARPKPTGRPKGSQPFTDVNPFDRFAQTAENLFNRGIIAGYPSDVKGELLFKPDNPINRAEFTQITLKMLCIVPREEAKKLPTPFYDVINPKEWFYPVLKEGNIRGFIKGYVGESRTDPDGATRTPFKPGNNITWAEASTIVLAALYEEDIIDLSQVDFTAPPGGSWYTKYIEVAQDLKPYVRRQEDASVRAFLITAEEAKLADKPISRGDFATMAERVLLIYDCFDPDTDDDGLPDRWERDEAKGEPVAVAPDDDPDGDTCPNSQEYKIGTDPLKADTDSGGVLDCVEVERGTDPVNNPYDDRPQAPAEVIKNEEGIYVLRPDCGNVCPCRATIGPGADLLPSDLLFAAITGEGGLPIYAKSNEARY